MKNFAAALFFGAAVLLSTAAGASEGVSDSPQQASEKTGVAAASSSVEPKQLSPASAAPKKAPSYLRKAPEQKAAPVASKKGPDLMRIILALFLVGVLGGIAIYAKRKKGGARLLKEQVRLHTIGSVQLGPKSQVALLSVGREAILVGVSEGGISSLRTYKEEELGSLTTAEAPKKRPLSSLPPAEEEASEAFNQLLVSASKDDAKKIQAITKKAAKEKLPPDEFTPTGFTDESLDSGPRAASDDMPPHLAAILAEPSNNNVRAIHSARPAKELPSSSSAAFGEPEGQAAELIRRFSELAR